MPHTGDMTDTMNLTAADVREGDLLVSFFAPINGIHSNTTEVGQVVASVTRETYDVLNASSTARVATEFAVLKTEGRSTYRLPLDRPVTIVR